MFASAFSPNVTGTHTANILHADEDRTLLAHARRNGH